MCNKPELILQIDCDSESVMQNHYGVTVGQEKKYYSALDIYVHKFQRAELKSTLFVVGKDVENRNVQQHLWNAVNNGCEIANHSFGHSNTFSAMSDKNFQTEVQKTNHAVYSVFGMTCKGFRAPNFDMRPSYLKILKQEGFQYDCSILSTPYIPVIRFLKEADADNSGYLGNIYRAPTKPYVPDDKKLWKSKKNINGEDVIEIPVTTFPYLRFPCHFSYLLATNFNIARWIMTALVNWHKRRKKALIFVFHLADLVDNKFLFGSEHKYYKSLEERLFLLDRFIDLIRGSFHSVTTFEYCSLLKAGVI